MSSNRRCPWNQIVVKLECQAKRICLGPKPACSDSVFLSWADNPVFIKSEYHTEMKKIIKMIKKETGINEEMPQFCFYPLEIDFIKQAVEEECRRSKKQWERIEKLHVEDMKEMEKSDSKKKVTNLQIVRDKKKKGKK